MHAQIYLSSHDVKFNSYECQSKEENKKKNLKTTCYTMLYFIYIGYFSMVFSSGGTFYLPKCILNSPKTGIIYFILYISSSELYHQECFSCKFHTQAKTNQTQNPEIVNGGQGVGCNTTTNTYETNKNQLSENK